jgi:DNA-binding CsgD family transcriptional regulator
MIVAPILIEKQEEKNGESGVDVMLLVEQLVKQTASAREPGQDEGEDVILDVEVEGVRCVLIRQHSKPARGQVALSPREQEIARMVAKGYPNKIIADVLDISSWTVCTHLRRMFAKLGVGSRAAMVARLLAEGLMGEHGLPGEDAHAARKPVISR